MKKKTRRKKSDCYEAYRLGVCLGKMTRNGTPGCRCLKCRWFEDKSLCCHLADQLKMIGDQFDIVNEDACDEGENM